jgi:hypothetical protein
MLLNAKLVKDYDISQGAILQVIPVDNGADTNRPAVPRKYRSGKVGSDSSGISSSGNSSSGSSSNKNTPSATRKTSAVGSGAKAASVLSSGEKAAKVSSEAANDLSDNEPGEEEEEGNSPPPMQFSFSSPSPAPTFGRLGSSSEPSGINPELADLANETKEEEDAWEARQAAQVCVYIRMNTCCQM